MSKQINEVKYVLLPPSPYKRVGIYCRVSTMNRQQITSLSSQVSGLTQKVFQEHYWNLADTYIDIQSGTTIGVRDEYQRMISDCEKNKLDIILTRSISRFGRNTVDLLNTLHKLTSLGIEVIFDEENISSADQNNTFIISLLESVAQEDSFNHSKNVYW